MEDVDIFKISIIWMEKRYLGIESPYKTQFPSLCLKTTKWIPQHPCPFIKAASPQSPPSILTSSNPTSSPYSTALPSPPSPAFPLNYTPSPPMIFSGLTFVLPLGRPSTIHVFNKSSLLSPPATAHSSPILSPSPISNRWSWTSTLALCQRN